MSMSKYVENYGLRLHVRFVADRCSKNGWAVTKTPKMASPEKFREIIVTIRRALILYAF